MDYYNLDEKDIVILQTLAKDSRTKLSSIADQLSISIPTVRSRINKLISLGIIQDFTITVSYDLLSEHPGYFLTIKCLPNRLNSIINQLNKKESFLEVHELVGLWQIFIRTIPLSMQDLQELLTELRNIGGINEINTMPLATTYKHITTHLPSQDIRVRLRCEYCGKLIEKDYQTLVIDDVTHFLCCKSCLAAFSEKIESQTEI
ncbi:MAG: winged helix-turn-helix transcriptional regulator [Candidatus Hodarchaeales archaeon]|jgi:DNA-binding Lrp family transcriptional regulator